MPYTLAAVGGAWIDYAGPRGTVPTYHFSDLVNGKVDPARLRGRVVVVGASAPTLQDVHSTPTASDRLMSGPEIQANAISTALRETQLEIVQRLSQAAESRDGDTGEHIQRIRRMTQKLALAVGLHEHEAELIGHASAMHDVGKIGIPDCVLLEPGRLHAEEWALMQSHTTIGAEILAGSTSALLQLAEEIARTHHERFDGTGYPVGLRDLTQLADARGDDQGDPGVGVLALGQSTPAGATERIHSRNTESPTRA